MSATDQSHQLEAAAAAVAAAATASTSPVLAFRTADLLQVCAKNAGELWVPPAPSIIVASPTEYVDQDHLEDLCAHRLRTEVRRYVNRTGRRLRVTEAQFAQAVARLVAATERRDLPGDWVALRAEDLSEIGMRDFCAGDGRLAGGIIWISLAHLPRRYEAALAPARRRIEQAARTHATRRVPEATVTRPVPPAWRHIDPPLAA